MAIWQSLSSGVQIRQDRPFSLIRIDTTRVNRGEFEEQLNRQGVPIQKQWSEGERFALFRVQTAALKFPELFEPKPEPQAPISDIAPEPVVQDAPTEQQFTGQVNVEQVKALREWAEARGARVEIGQGFSTKEGTVFDYRIVAQPGTDLLAGQAFVRETQERIFRPTEFEAAIGGFQQTEQLEIPLPTTEAIQKQREREAVKLAAERVVTEREGDVIGAAQLQAMTLFSARSQQFVGSFFTEKVEPRDVIVESIREEIMAAKVERGRTVETTFTLQAVDPEAFTKRSVLPGVDSALSAVRERKVRETFLSVPVQIAAAGVAGFAVGASAAVATIGATTAGKVGLASVTIGSVGLGAVDIATTPDEATKIGKAITLGVGFGVGVAGFKLGRIRLSKTTIELSRVSGESLNIRQADAKEFKTFGQQIVEARTPTGKAVKVKVFLEAESRLLPGKRAVSDIKVFIPKQKSVGVKIPEQKLFVEAVGTKTPKGFKIETGAGSVDIFIDDKIVSRTIITRKATQAILKQVTEQRTKDVLIRTFTGKAIEIKSQKLDVGIAVDIDAPRISTVTTRAGTSAKALQLIGIKDYTISAPAPASGRAIPVRLDLKPLPGAIIQKATSGIPPSIKTAVIPKSVPAKLPAPPPTGAAVAGVKIAAVDTSISRVGAVPVMAVPSVASKAIFRADIRIERARLMPAVAMADIKVETAKSQLIESVAVMPAAVQSVSITGLGRAEVMRQAPVVIQEAVLKLPSVEDVTEIQAQAFRQASKVPGAQALEEITAPPVVVAPPIPPPPKPPVIPGLPVGFIMLPKTRVKIPKTMIRTIINPIPKQLKIRIPKLKVSL